MTTSTLNSILLRALRRRSPQSEAELIVVAKEVFGPECHSSTVAEQLRDLDDLGLITRESDPDGILPPSCALTVKGQHKAKLLG